MSRVIVPPETAFAGGEARATARRVFLAGGITGCPDWQAEAIAAFEGSGFLLLNPRRPGFAADGLDAEAQIKWEFDHLRGATDILFWFPMETLCPIALFELGTWLAIRAQEGRPRLFIGCHPRYKRRLDVVTQARLIAPDIHVVDSVAKLVAQVRAS